MAEIRAPDKRVQVKKDLTGMKFGRWTVLERVEDHVQPNGARTAMWLCRCDCGTERAVSHTGLTCNRAHSCGCLKAEVARKMCQDRKMPIVPGMMAKVKHDLTGQKFGKLTVIRQAPDHICSSGKRDTMWECRCDCGKITQAKTWDLTSGHKVSCGCIRDSDEYREHLSEKATIHGGSRVGRKERLYRVWCAMIERCGNPHNSHYVSYGGRGIKVCEEWRNSYDAFRTWALANGYDGQAQRGQCTIDRIDVNGNYCPENCRWVSMDKQANNKRNSHMLTFQGKTQTISEWAKEIGVGATTLLSRIDKRGWSVEKALTTPADPMRRRKFYTYNGVTKSLSEWARDSGIGMKQLWARLDYGWDFEDAITRPIRVWPSQMKADKEKNNGTSIQESKKVAG